jgi:hypothetical protein
MKLTFESVSHVLITRIKGVKYGLNTRLNTFERGFKRSKSLHIIDCLGLNLILLFWEMQI